MKVWYKLLQSEWDRLIQSLLKLDLFHIGMWYCIVREEYDSPVIYKKVFHNQEQIQMTGIKDFFEEQYQRIEVLKYSIYHFDNVFSKSSFVKHVFCFRSMVYIKFPIKAN